MIIAHTNFDGGDPYLDAEAEIKRLKRDYADIKAGLTFYAATACDDNETKRLLEAADAFEELRRNLKDCRNELCLKCGEYKQRHLGACDGCRWKEPIE